MRSRSIFTWSSFMSPSLTTILPWKYMVIIELEHTDFNRLEFPENPMKLKKNWSGRGHWPRVSHLLYLPLLWMGRCLYIITARKRSLWRLCFYRCLSVHRGVCMAGGACVARGCAWQGGGLCSRGACMAGGMCGRGACMVGVCVAGGYVWQGGMHGRGVHGRGVHGGGCAWQGACMAGGMHGRGECVAGRHVWQGVCAWQGGMCGRGAWHALSCQ